MGGVVPEGGGAGVVDLPDDGGDGEGGVFQEIPGLFQFQGVLIAVWRLGKIFFPFPEEGLAGEAIFPGQFLEVNGLVEVFLDMESHLGDLLLVLLGLLRGQGGGDGLPVEGEAEPVERIGDAGKEEAGDGGLDFPKEPLAFPGEGEGDAIFQGKEK